MMYHTTGYLAFLIILGQTAYASPIAHRCISRKEAVPFLRAFKPWDHFYTTDPAEMQRAVAQGYTEETSLPQGLIFPHRRPGLIPLYRLYSESAVDHFYTIDRHERDDFIKHSDYANQGIAGYVYPKERCGATPLYRQYNEGVKDHFYTPDAGERDRAVGLGYINQKNAGFILPSI